MDTRQFFAASRALIVAGKGGTGKSVVSRALATVATGSGMSVLHVRIDRKGQPAASAEDVAATGTVTGPPGADSLVLSPGAALAEYLHGRGLGVLTKQLDRLGIVDLVAGTAPGIDDLLVLGKIKQLVRDDPHDVIIIDGPAAGQALDLLRAPQTLKKTVRGGPIAQQADDVLRMFSEKGLVRVMLVARPAMTPVTELIETAGDIESTLGVHLAPVVVNGLHADVPEAVTGGVDAGLDRAIAYVRERHAAETSAVRHLARALPLHQLHAGHHVASGEALVGLVAGDLDDAIEEMP